MTDIQKKIISLMDEIVEICQKENLSYILANETATYAEKNKTFKDERYHFKIMMPYNDIVKLENYVEKNLSDKRFIESWRNNPHLRQMKFRYVDKGTLLYDTGSPEYHNAMGICVTIFPARQFEASKKARGSERYIQAMSRGCMRSDIFKLAVSKQTSRFKKDKNDVESKSHKIRIDNNNYIQKGFFKGLVFRPEKIAASVMKQNDKATKPYYSQTYVPKKKLAEDKNYREECFAYVDEKCNVIKLPKDLFTNVKEVEFEGRKYKSYKKLKVIIKAIYFDAWKKAMKGKQPSADRVVVIADTDMPYEVYMKEVGEDSIKELAAKKGELNYWLSYVYKPALKRTNKDYRSIRASVYRIDIWYELKDKREELRKAYEAEDLDTLSSIMSNYIKTSEKNRKFGIGFYIDDELFKYARYIWEKGKGKKPAYADKIYSLVPETYKNETPEDYLRAQGVIV